MRKEIAGDVFERPYAWRRDTDASLKHITWYALAFGATQSFSPHHPENLDEDCHRLIDEHNDTKGYT